MLGMKLSNIFKYFIAASYIGLGISYGPLYLMHIMIILYLTYKITTKHNVSLPKIKPLYIQYELLILITWYVASILWAENIVYSLQYIAYLLIGFIVAYSIVFECSNADKVKQIIKVLSIVGLVEIVISSLELMGIARWPISPYSRFVSLFRMDINYYDILDINKGNYNATTPTGFRWNPNNLGVTMTILLPFAAMNGKKWIRYILSTVILSLIVASGSRGSLLGASTAIMIILFSNKMYKLFIFVFAIISTTFVLNPEYVYSKVNNDFVSDIVQAVDSGVKILTVNERWMDSIGVRQRLMENGIEALVESKGLGVGAGNSKTVQENKGTVAGVTSMHNFWLEIIVESGLLMGITFIIWYIYLIYELIKSLKRFEDNDIKNIATSCVIALVSFSLSAISASSVIYMPPMWILFGLSMALINLSRKLAKTRT